MSDGDPKRGDPEGEESLVTFFRSLTPAARREYEMLADLDRRFGEDVAAEMRS